MTHQEGIARCLTALLAQDTETIAIFRRGNPFDKLIRSYDEYNSIGEGLYRNIRGKNHYKMSVDAYNSGLPANKLYGEHCIPIKLIIKELMELPQINLATVLLTLQRNEVVLITDSERNYLDSSVEKGGLGVRSRMPFCGRTRLEAAGIAIAPETLNKGLLVL